MAGHSHGSLFGSLAVVADGFHIATHALALFIAALAYTYARRHANDTRFVFGTGKLGDLAGYTGAIVLAMRFNHRRSGDDASLRAGHAK